VVLEFEVVVEYYAILFVYLAMVVQDFVDEFLQVDEN